MSSVITNAFLDTEFTNLPWRPSSSLISIGIYTEDLQSYYACTDDFDPGSCSPFVLKSVLPNLGREPAKSTPQIAAELDDFFETYKRVQFWAVFPTMEQIHTMSDLPKKSNGHHALSDAKWNFALWQKDRSEPPGVYLRPRRKVDE